MLGEATQKYLDSISHKCKAKLYIHRNECSPVDENQLMSFVGPHYPDTPGDELCTESTSLDLKEFLETPEGMEWFYEHRPKGVILVHAADRDVYVR